MATKCHVCGFQNAEGDEFCDECGVKLQLPGEAPSAAVTAAHAPVTAPPASAPTTPPSVPCPACRAPQQASSRFCNGCGARMRAEDGSPAGGCPRCGAPVDADDDFCASCGDPRKPIDASGLTIPAASERRVPAEEAVFKLTVVTGHEKDRVYLMDKDEARLGRGGDNDVILGTDGYVSSRHTRVFRTAEGFFVEDMGSTNGTFLRVKKPAKLVSGDEIKVGQSIFRFEPSGD